MEERRTLIHFAKQLWNNLCTNLEGRGINVMKKVFLCSLILFLLLLVPGAWAHSLNPWGGPSSGSVTFGDFASDDGIVDSGESLATDGWVGRSMEYSVSTVIGGAYDGWLQYYYKFNTLLDDGSETKGISHGVIQLSDGLTFDDLVYVDQQADNEINEWGNDTNNPGLTENTYGIKIDEKGSVVEITLLSTRSPMEGTVYWKDGVFGTAGNQIDVWAWAHDTVPVPDTDVPIPEPATLVLVGIGLLGIAGFGRKKFKK
jgi:hypothetical protein